MALTTSISPPTPANTAPMMVAVPVLDLLPELVDPESGEVAKVADAPKLVVVDWILSLSALLIGKSER